MQPPDKVEEAVGELFLQIYNLIHNGKISEAYDSLGVIIKMAQEDREVLRNKYEMEYL